MAIRQKQSLRSRAPVTLDVLTPREREVMSAVANGLTNRQTGTLLGISHRTVEVHRARLMRKLEVDSIAELVAIYLMKGRPRHKSPRSPPRQG